MAAVAAWGLRGAGDVARGRSDGRLILSAGPARVDVAGGVEDGEHFRLGLACPLCDVSGDAWVARFEDEARVV